MYSTSAEYGDFSDRFYLENISVDEENRICRHYEQMSCHGIIWVRETGEEEDSSIVMSRIETHSQRDGVHIELRHKFVSHTSKSRVCIVTNLSKVHELSKSCISGIYRHDPHGPNDKSGSVRKERLRPF